MKKRMMLEMKEDSPSLQRLIDSFKRAEEKVNKIFLKTKANSVQQLKVKIDRELKNINLELITKSKKWSESDIEDAYKEGVDRVSNYCSNKQAPSESSVPDSTVLNPYIELSDRISKATHETIESVNKIISNSLETGITSVYDVKKKFQEEMIRQNNSMTVRYENGAKVPISAYSSMVARTARIEASNTGSLDRCKEIKIDLVKCTVVPNCCPYCRKYEGKVYSISGKDNRFRSLYGDDGPFQHGYNIMHPNCRHEFLPYIEDLQTDEQLKRDIEESNHFTNYSKNDKIFNKYQENQSKMRQYREEYKQYRRLKTELGNDMPYKTLGGFRRASRHYKLMYPKQPNKIKDFEVRVRLKSDVYPKKLRIDKQKTHFKDFKDYSPTNSYLTISIEEIQQLINKYSGTGELQYKSDGVFLNKEIIECDKIIGYHYSLEDNKFYPTNRFYIHYSKSKGGTHIVPTISRRRYTNGTKRNGD